MKNITRAVVRQAIKNIHKDIEMDIKHFEEYDKEFENMRYLSQMKRSWGNDCSMDIN